MYTIVIDLYNGVLSEVKLFINNPIKANEYFINQCKEINDIFGQYPNQEAEALAEGFYENGPDSVYIYEPEIEE